jgi:hypothetical protein
VALSMIEAIDHQLAPLERELRALARRQRGCRALMGLFGVGELVAPAILCELGDATRLRRSRQAVRFAGIDVGVHRSDRRSRLGKPTRQGTPQLRWALYEAAQSACRATSPAHAEFLALKQRGKSHTQASLTIARKLARRSFHVLRGLGPDALQPVTDRGVVPIFSAKPSNCKMAARLPASSRTARGSRPRAAAQKTPSGRSRSQRNDRQPIPSPAEKPRTQATQGVRGAIGTNRPSEIHIHSPPDLTGRPLVQVTERGRARERSQWSALASIAGAARRRFAAAERGRICGGDRSSPWPCSLLGIDQAPASLRGQKGPPGCTSSTSGAPRMMR